jgi:uncharacterized protein (TIGR02646 family)
VIHVDLKPEPPRFDAQVRQPGMQWLRSKHIDLDLRLPVGLTVPPKWRNCLDDLHEEYGGICAYLAVYIERAIGATTADHYVAKSSKAKLIYEWDNYRLACLVMNARKGAFDDVLDPALIPEGLFQLELVTGRIFINPKITGQIIRDAQNTINRLKLDNGINREMRARHFDEFIQGVPESFLKRRSPFVWAEARRQGLL